MSNPFMRLLATLTLTAPLLVNANSINYGNFNWSQVDFLGVTETSMSTGDTAPLFGSPTLVGGSSLVFTHMTFVSQAANGASDITDGKLDATIDAVNNPNAYIDKIKFQEFGDTTLAGTGTAATYSSAAGSIFITVFEVNNVPLLFPEFITYNMVMSEGGSWTLAGGPLTGHIWNGVLTVDLTTELLNRGIMGQATLVDLSLDNTLATGSELNTSAYIAKKAEGLLVTAEIVPEPSVLSLLLFGGWLIRRKR
jgi:hypothetical protein